MELKFCKSDVYFLNRPKNVYVATCNFVSVYCYCGSSVALPPGALGWSAVCDCGIS